MDACILIGTPSYDGRVHAQYMVSVLNSSDHLRGHGVEVAVAAVRGGLLPGLRNGLVRVALENGCSHLLFADADQAWPADAPLRLFGWGKDMVSAVVQSRHQPTFDLLNPRPVAGEAPLLEVDAIGAGFLLLSRACMLRMAHEHPGRMFEFVHGREGDPWHTHSEDVTFCARWRGLGGRIHADPGFRMSHFGERDCNAMLHETSNRGWGSEEAIRTETPAEPAGAREREGAQR